MAFLETRDGLIADRAIVRMFPFCVDRGQKVYWIDYELGGLLKQTVAIELSVEKFLLHSRRK